MSKNPIKPTEPLTLADADTLSWGGDLPLSRSPTRILLRDIARAEAEREAAGIEPRPIWPALGEVLHTPVAIFGHWWAQLFSWSPS